MILVFLYFKSNMKGLKQSQQNYITECKKDKKFKKLRIIIKLCLT